MSSDTIPFKRPVGHHEMAKERRSFLQGREVLDYGDTTNIVAILAVETMAMDAIEEVTVAVKPASLGDP